MLGSKRIEYILEWNLLVKSVCVCKKCKTVILLYCFHTAGVPLYNLLGPEHPEHYFIENLKLILKKPNYEIGWVHNWPMIISQIIDQWSFQNRLYAFHFSNDDFSL